MPQTVKEDEKKTRKHRGLKAVLWTILGIWLAVMVVLQVFLNSAVLTKIANRISSEYVDGDATFSGIKASMLRSFPNLNVCVEDFSLTYPHDRFAQYDTIGGLGAFLLKQGRGEEVDTLAHFNKLELSVNYMKLIGGRIRVAKAILDNPRIFAHQYDSTAANWDIIKAKTSQSQDTTKTPLPSFSIGKMSLEGKPLVIYTNQADTISASMLLKQMTARGRYDVKKSKVEKAEIDIDSLFIAGRLPSDTVAFALQHLGFKDHESHYDLDLKSDILLALRSTGRMKIPFQMDAKFLADLEGKVYTVEELKASLAAIDIEASGLLDLSAADPFVKANATIDKEPVSELIECFGENFPILKKLRTDAKVSLEASCEGHYIQETKSLPPMSVHLSVPDASVAWQGLDEKGRFDLEATATSENGLLKTVIPDFCFSIEGAKVSLSGNCDDLLADDPSIAMDAEVHAVLDSLVRFIPDSLDIHAHGNMDGTVKGSFQVSQLDIFNFAEIGLRADLESDGIRISIPKDTIYARLGRTAITLGPYSHTEHGSSEHAGEGEHHHVGLSARIDTIAAEYGAATFIQGRKLVLSAHNSEEIVGKDPNNHPLHAHLDVKSLGMMDLDSTYVGVEDSENVLKLTQKKEKGIKVPYINLTSNNGGMSIREGVNRASAKKLVASIAAHPEASNSKMRRKHLLDSLQKVYPGVPKDSLLSVAFKNRSKGSLPDYLSEKDFAKKDINIQLGESIAKYIKEWQIVGNIKMDEGQFITPYFPLENRITGFSGKLTNDVLKLNDLSLQSGSSDIHASGTLTGLKRALTSGKGRLKLDLGINSDYIDLNEILLAVNQGKQFQPESGSKAALTDANDSEYLSAVQLQAAQDSVPESTLIVIPSNLEARVSVNANTVKYSNLETSWVSSDMEMKQRCLQLTNTMAMTNMGDVYVEGFYSTRTKKDLKAGFDLTFSNITAEKVIELFPAVDSIMPMLKAFKGLLDCEMAATTSIDTSMNIVLPTLSGMIKIDGKNLSLAESSDLDKLRKTLMFKDKDSSYIDAMSVRGIIKEDHLEVFPFILKVDRYTIALNGLQKFDQNFKYHVSALKSPLPFRFGVNLKGSFADWGWKLGKAKYKSEKIPLFDEEVDGLKYNLLSAIHNIFDHGVEKALQQNEQSQAAIEEKKSEMSYSVEETEELSEEERKQLEGAAKD